MLLCVKNIELSNHRTIFKDINTHTQLQMIEFCVDDL